MYRHKLETLHWDVLEQDRVILENMEPDARDREFLYQHDTGLARSRRMVEGAAKSQLATVAGQSARAVK